MMRTRYALLAVAALAIVSPAAADDKVGPAVGDAAPTFDVEDVTGPNKGKTLCYV
jgi:hypothetical protein